MYVCMYVCMYVGDSSATVFTSDKRRLNKQSPAGPALGRRGREPLQSRRGNNVSSVLICMYV